MLLFLSKSKAQGFSLIEILISLFIVSLAAVNMAGLQQVIATQQQDNIIHSDVISVATAKMEKVLNLATLDDLMAIDGITETGIKINNSELIVDWQVSDVSDNFKTVSMQISWQNAQGKNEHFTYSKQVNLALVFSSLPETVNSDQLAAIIPSVLTNNQVLYFEPQMGYETGSFVIYDSYLYQTTKPYIAGNDYPHSLDSLDENEGWLSYGAIDNPDLVHNSDIATYFLE
jgi:prepilin-type N-terminal cleavage/methylation domain-containing protein